MDQAYSWETYRWFKKREEIAALFFTLFLFMAVLGLAITALLSTGFL